MQGPIAVQPPMPLLATVPAVPSSPAVAWWPACCGLPATTSDLPPLTAPFEVAPTPWPRWAWSTWQPPSPAARPSQQPLISTVPLPVRIYAAPVPRAQRTFRTEPPPGWISGVGCAWQQQQQHQHPLQHQQMACQVVGFHGGRFCCHAEHLQIPAAVAAKTHGGHHLSHSCLVYGQHCPPGAGCPPATAHCAALCLGYPAGNVPGTAPGGPPAHGKAETPPSCGCPLNGGGNLGRQAPRGRAHSGAEGRSRQDHRSPRQHRRHGGRNCDPSCEVRLPCGLLPSQISDLLFREITPEDYDLLLQLDENIVKPTAKRASVESLPLASREQFKGGSCLICLSTFERSDKVTALPCQHLFHRSCIEKWLLERKNACPLCCAEVFPS